MHLSVNYPRDALENPHQAPVSTARDLRGGLRLRAGAIHFRYLSDPEPGHDPGSVALEATVSLEVVHVHLDGVTVGGLQADAELERFGRL